MAKKNSMPLLAMLEDLDKPKKILETPLKGSPIKKPVERRLKSSGESVLVIFRGDEEVSHWNCEDEDVEQFKKSSEASGRRVEVYPKEEYYAKMKRNEFQMSREGWGDWRKK